MSLPLLVLIVVALLGLFLQCTMGLILVLRRPLSPFGAMLLPLMALLGGTGWSAYQVELLYQKMIESVDDPSLSQSLLGERAGCWEGLTAGAFLSIAMVIPLLGGVAVASLRAKVPKGQRRSWMPTLVAALAAFPGPIVIWMGLLKDAFHGLWIPAIGLPLLLAPGVVGLGAPRTRSLAASALLTGLLALLLGSYGWTQYWIQEESLKEALLSTIGIQPFLNLGIFAAGVAVIAGWMAGATSRSSLSVVAAPLGTLLLQAIQLGFLGWMGLRLLQLGKLSGLFELTLAQVAVEFPGSELLPHQEGLPGRVLLASKHLPHWLLRSSEGIQALPLEGELIDLGPRFQRGDGLLLRNEMSMGDFYLMLSGTEAGSVSLVGCQPPDPVRLRLTGRDPLLSTGWCGSVPILLRPGLSGRPQRELILLKDRQVDDNGEIVLISTLKPEERLLLRAQVDATVGDLLALLVRMPVAEVVLGWGVELDGTDLPVGVE